MKLMVLRNFIILLIITGSLTISACSGGNGEDLYETAQFEELQNNPEHAMKLYEELIEKYPDSEYAAKARDRISEMAE